MSLSEALDISFVHHFYPIDPATSSQQSSAVLNPPTAPLVAPIPPFVLPQPREPKIKTSKRKLDDEDFEEIEIEELILPSTPRPKRPRNHDMQSRMHATPVWLPPPGQRKKAFVEIPILRSFDKASYKQISLSSYFAEYSRTGSIDQPATSTPTISSVGSLWSPSASPSPSVIYVSSHEPDSTTLPSQDNTVHLTRTSRMKKPRKSRKPNTRRTVRIEQDDATTCHQCRRKTTSAKMKCRRVYENGAVCPFSFCQTCIRGRYDEEFNRFHSTWRCPRCRGMCNCSICLRKAGIAYVLNIAGGSLSNTKMASKETGQVSVRRWLARRGLALGTDEWMDEQRGQGVRYFVGRSPPPRDRPSPYKEARFTSSLVACNEQEEADDITFPLDPRLKGSSGCTADANVEAPSHLTESVTVGPSSRSMGPDIEKDSPITINHASTVSGSFDQRPPSTLSCLSSSERSLLELPRDSSPNPYMVTEDLPGLSLIQTRRIRLIVGRKIPRRTKRMAPYKTKRLLFRKARESSKDVESPNGKVELKIILPPIHVRREPGSSTTSDEDEPDEYDNEHLEAGSLSGSGNAPPFLDDDTPATPPPPPSEPVFVPNEHYTPSKLDLAHVQDPNSRFAQSFWTLETFGGHLEHDTETLPRSEKVLYTHPPPCDDVSADDASQQSQSLRTGFTITLNQKPSSMSTSRPENDFLVPQSHESGYPTSGVSPFAALDESWIAGSGIDMPMLQMEHLVDPRLSSPGAD